MKRILAIFIAGLITAGSALAQPVLLEKADALPLSLNDDFSFRKVKTYRHVSQADERAGLSDRSGATVDQMITFEAKRRSYGAITRVDEHQRFGNYITLFWRADRPANVVVRLEYRQSNLGPYVQAQEIAYENVTGNRITEFAIIGDDFRWDGPTTSWRALLIENGAIVGLHSSFLWN